MKKILAIVTMLAESGYYVFPVAVVTSSRLLTANTHGGILPGPRAKPAKI